MYTREVLLLYDNKDVCYKDLSLSLLHDNPNLMWDMPQGLTEHRKMGFYLHKKGISTGTLTRIVTNTMEQIRQSEFFFLQLFVPLLLVFTLFALFLDYMPAVTFFIWVLNSNLKVPVRNVSNMCVIQSLVMLKFASLISIFIANMFYRYVLIAYMLCI